mgnify:CR=1 FL=1
MYNYALSSLESLENASMRDLSAANFKEPESELLGGDQFILNGASTVTNLLAKGVDVALKTTVKEIEVVGLHNVRVHVSSRDGAGVATESTLPADMVVVTCPIAVLQQNASEVQHSDNSSAIKFSPPLPTRKVQAMGRIGAGLFNKVRPGAQCLGFARMTARRVAECINCCDCRSAM